MISRQEAQAKFSWCHEAQGSHDEVYTDGSKMNEGVGAVAVINRHFQNGETTCHQQSKRLPDNSSIFAAEATAISLTLNYYRHMVPVHHDVVVYSDSMSCLQAIEGEDTENPFICHIMNLRAFQNSNFFEMHFGFYSPMMHAKKLICQIAAKSVRVCSPRHAFYDFGLMGSKNAKFTVHTKNLKLS